MDLSEVQGDQALLPPLPDSIKLVAIHIGPGSLLCEVFCDLLSKGNRHVLEVSFVQSRSAAFFRRPKRKLESRCRVGSHEDPL